MKRLCVCLVCLVLLTQVQAQEKKKKKRSTFNKQNKEADAFLQKQWWLGFKGGVNLADAVVGKTYSAISPTNYDVAEIAKKYEHFNKIGSQATLEITFYYKGVSFSIQPTYRHSRFVYSNQFSWIDTENDNNRLDLNYAQEQKIIYFDLPYLVKYTFYGDKLRPYVQAGGFTSFLINANKSVKISGTDYASGGTNEFSTEPIIVGATDLFAKNYWGILWGGGVNYILGNIRLNFDVMYKYGISNISSSKNRYGSDRLSGVGDTLDDIRLNNLTFSLGCLFPLRFLESAYKSTDRKK
jgi:hypothetical protein